MNELFNRDVKIGDFVYAEPACGTLRLKEDYYGLVVSSTQCYIKKGIRKINTCYLIEHPCEQELEIKQSLVKSYSNYMLIQQQLLQQRDIRRKELDKAKIKKYVPGDCFKFGYNCYHLYIGIVKCTPTSHADCYYGYDTKNEWLHGYVSLTQEEILKLENILSLNCESLKEIFSQNRIETQKALSQKYTELYKHFDILKDCYTSPIVCEKYCSYWTKKKEFLFDFEVCLKGV